MIRIRIQENNHKIDSLSVSGHANAGPYGADLVCAGVSCLMTGALNGLDMLFPEACALSIDNNTMAIQVIHNNKDLQLVLNFLMAQLQTMQEAYPERIKMEKKEV